MASGAPRRSVTSSPPGASGHVTPPSACRRLPLPGLRQPGLGGTRVQALRGRERGRERGRGRRGLAWGCRNPPRSTAGSAAETGSVPRRRPLAGESGPSHQGLDRGCAWRLRADVPCAAAHRAVWRLVNRAERSSRCLEQTGRSSGSGARAVWCPVASGVSRVRKRQRQSAGAAWRRGAAPRGTRAALGSARLCRPRARQAGSSNFTRF